MRFLVLQLVGPMAAWGADGAIERRPVYPEPSRSAVLGIVGAALGIERGDPRLGALDRGYGFGCVAWAGQPLIDYHTVLQGDKTSITYRDYATGSWSAACLWELDGAPATLDRIADALRHPVFPLALGRRCCPPALPLAPQVVTVTNPVEALQTRFPSDEVLERALLRPGGTYRYCYEGDFPDLAANRTVTRRDRPHNRAQWLFVNRDEHVYLGPRPRR